MVATTRIASLSVLAAVAAFVCAGAAPVLADTSDGLVGHWPLDEGRDIPIAVDTVSHNNGDWQGAGSRYVNDGPSGIADIAGQFSQDDERYVVVPHSAAYDFDESFSASLWVKPSAWMTWNALLASDNWDSQLGWAVYVSEEHGGLGVLCYEAPVHGTICTDPLVPLSEWTHIAVVNDHGDASIYIDGSLAASGSVPVVHSFGTLMIGARHLNEGTSATDIFIGALSDVRLYDRALNASDIEALRTGSDSSASSESQSGAGGGRGNYTAASYNVDLRSHQYVMASSSSSSSSSSSHHAAAPVRADQSVVARICSRLARRQFSPAALERINVRLLQRFGSTCAVR